MCEYLASSLHEPFIQCLHFKNELCEYNPFTENETLHVIIFTFSKFIQFITLLLHGIGN